MRASDILFAALLAALAIAAPVAVAVGIANGGLTNHSKGGQA